MVLNKLINGSASTERFRSFVTARVAVAGCIATYLRERTFVLGIKVFLQLLLLTLCTFDVAFVMLEMAINITYMLVILEVLHALKKSSRYKITDNTKLLNNEHFQNLVAICHSYKVYLWQIETKFWIHKYIGMCIYIHTKQ